MAKRRSTRRSTPKGKAAKGKTKTTTKQQPAKKKPRTRRVPYTNSRDLSAMHPEGATARVERLQVTIRKVGAVGSFDPADHPRPTPSPFALMVEHELAKARAKHPPMHSAHEAHSTILEEFEEWWDHVKAESAGPDAVKELAQVAAMCQRAAEDVYDV